MRVGLLIYGSLDTISGGYLYDRKVIEYLQRQGDQVEIISLPWRNYALHLCDNFSSQLHRRLQCLDVDVLIQDELNHPSLFAANRLLKPRLLYPVLSIVHHLRCSEQRPAWQNYFYRQVEQRYLDTLDGLIYNSQTTRRVVMETSLQCANRPYVVAYPAGDRLALQIADAEIEQRARAPGPLRLLFLGNLIERKGLHTLLAALAALPKGRFHLTVIGRQESHSAYARRLAGLMAEAQLAPYLTFKGYQDNENLAAELRQAQVLVVPSSYEGFGIAYLEGMAAGLPAIGSTAGAASEVITHGQDGFLIPPGDAAALTQHLQSLDQDRGRLAQLGLSARRRYLAHPGWEDTAHHIRQFLIEFCQNRVGYRSESDPQVR